MSMSPRLRCIAVFLAVLASVALTARLFCLTPRHVFVPAAQFRSSENRLQVHFIDVGQGDASLVRTPRGRFILIDGGGDTVRADGSVSDPGKDVIIPFLEKQGVRELDAIVISHAHPDHCGGLRAVLRRFPVQAVYDTGYRGEDDREYGECLEIVRSKHIAYRTVHSGDKLDWDPDLRVDVLGPPADLTFDSANNNSLIIKVAFGETSFLFPGDAGMDEEAWLARTWGVALAADVLKCPHHGSYSSSSKVFLKQVRPGVVVISCGLHNEFDHPHAGILARYRHRKATVFRTDYDGTVTLSSNGTQISGESQRSR